MLPVLALAMLSAGVPNAVVLKPVANMYSKATEDADVVSQAIYGANVGVLEQKEGWARIRTADEYTGWMPLAALKLGAPYAASGRVAQVESMYAHLYREADVTRHQPVITVPFETRLEVAAEPAGNTRWLQVRLPDDRSAWVQRGDLVFNPGPLTADQMIALSKRFLGLPYTWGGTSSYGYDCSGFAQMLCRRRGISLPRDAGPQARSSALVPVDKKDLAPGDLLYFGKSAARISHTGVYIGDGKFINATTWQHPMVRIDDLSDPHWSTILVACRRPK